MTRLKLFALLLTVAGLAAATGCNRRNLCRDTSEYPRSVTERPCDCP